MTTDARVLVVDDDPGVGDLLHEVLTREGYRVRVSTGGGEAAQLAETETFDLVLADVRMPDCDGLEVLRAFRRADPETIVIMMTAFGTLESAIEAIREGAFDYISKPFNLEEVKLTLRRALERRRLVAENLRFREELRERYRVDRLVGSSAAMLEVYKLVARVAPGRSTVLVQGESGTGKELVARAIHYNGPRAAQPFQAVDCGSLAETLLESELFGHVKGAFTGAVTTKRGLLEEAHGGTCFLDEVGDVGPNPQARILRFLQEHEIKPVGGTESRKVDVRVIAATNKDLEGLVKAGRFREDLFYRLNVVTIRLPPLRERREDIPVLAEHFLRKYAAENGKAVSQIAPESLAILQAYAWPGNVRELENIIERAVALTTSPILVPDDLPHRLMEHRAKPAPASGFQTLEEMERAHLLRALQEAGGNKKRAAQLLGIGRRTLYRMAERHGIKLSGPEEEAV